MFINFCSFLPGFFVRPDRLSCSQDFVAEPVASTSREYTHGNGLRSDGGSAGHNWKVKPSLVQTSTRRSEVNRVLRHSDDEPVASTSRDSSHESRVRNGDEIAGPSKRKFGSSLVPVGQAMIDKDEESEESSDAVDEANFRPQLSPSILNEIEGDDVDEVPARQLEVKREEPRQEFRSNAYSGQGIFKKQKMTTKLTDPKPIHPNFIRHHGNRFTLTNGALPPLRKSPKRRTRKGKDVDSIGKLHDKMKKEYNLGGVPSALKNKSTLEKSEIAVLATLGVDRSHENRNEENRVARSASGGVSIPTKANGKVSDSQKGKSIKAVGVGQKENSARASPEKVVSTAPQGKVSDKFLMNIIFVSDGNHHICFYRIRRNLPVVSCWVKNSGTRQDLTVCCWERFQKSPKLTHRPRKIIRFQF